MSEPTQTIAERSPIDYDAIRKGDFISPELIERVTATKRADYKTYNFALMGFKVELEREMQRRGHPIVSKTEGDGIRVLTDAEAVEYTASRHKNIAGQMVRNHVRSVAGVDTRNLSADQLRRHERDVIARSRELQAMKDSRRQFRSQERKPEALPKPE